MASVCVPIGGIASLQKPPCFDLHVGQPGQFQRMQAVGNHAYPLAIKRGDEKPLQMEVLMRTSSVQMNLSIATVDYQRRVNCPNRLIT